VSRIAVLATMTARVSATSFGGRDRTGAHIAQLTDAGLNFRAFCFQCGE
jgi:hypothetical protein